MTRKEAIIARRSVRQYTGEPISEEMLEKIEEFAVSVTPLHSDIRLTVEIMDEEDYFRAFKGFGLHRSCHYLVIRSADKPGYLENAGFIGQQIILYLTEKDIGSCWLGMASPRAEDGAGLLPYVATICFGRADNTPLRRSAEDAKRKHLDEIVYGKISDPTLLRLLDAGRLAPSAVNRQPVRYKTQSNNIYIYRKRGTFTFAQMERMQGIDVGAAMANIFVEADEKVSFIREANYPTPASNCVYEYTMVWNDEK